MSSDFHCTLCIKPLTADTDYIRDFSIYLEARHIKYHVLE